MTTATKTLPEFRGKSLVPKDVKFPQADFLIGDFGKAVNAEVQGKYKVPAIQKVKYSDGIVRGSNPFYVVAVNEILREQGTGLRTATQADLERVLATQALELRGQYEDSALVLRSKDEPNAYLAKHLADQVALRSPKTKAPVMIPLCGLELQVDGGSPHGFAFKLRDDAEIVHAPILNKDSAYFISEGIDEKTGLPKKVGDGGRYFYTRKTGLSRLYLNRYLNVNSNNENLANSNDNGRVVVVGEGGSRENLDALRKQTEELLAKQEKERKDLIEKLET